MVAIVVNVIVFFFSLYPSVLSVRIVSTYCTYCTYCKGNIDIVKKKKREIDKQNERVIDFYRLIDTIDINQIRFTEFYRFYID